MLAAHNLSLVFSAANLSGVLEKVFLQFEARKTLKLSLNVEPEVPLTRPAH